MIFSRLNGNCKKHRPSAPTNVVGAPFLYMKLLREPNASSLSLVSNSGVSEVSPFIPSTDKQWSHVPQHYAVLLYSVTEYSPYIYTWPLLPKCAVDKVESTHRDKECSVCVGGGGFNSALGTSLQPPTFPRTHSAAATAAILLTTLQPRGHD